MRNKRALRVMIPIAALLICGVVVLLERYGVTYEYATAAVTADNTELVYSQEVEEPTQCLVLISSEDEVSTIYRDMLKVVLDGMDVAFKVQEATDFDASELENYQTVILAIEDWSLLGEQSFKICDWVKGGGSMLCAMTPIPNGSFRALSGKLGIVSGGNGYATIDGIRFLENVVLGASKKGYSFGEEMDISLAVGLSENAEVYMESLDRDVPLLWRVDYGEGTIVVDNEILSEKYQRGFLCLAYSLLGDACIYPVINGSAFYLDDFPSPVPSGNSTYIQRDYGIDTGTFYATIWWPTILDWESEYGIRHTGLIIEEYSDDVMAPFERNQSTTQFVTYGNMLLNHGGELGLHGYNHMPLCMKGIDDAQQYGNYKLWRRKEDAVESARELTDFCREIFPEASLEVYVPPSNIMSESGKEALLEACPQVKVIASTFLSDADGKAYEQEFTVEENGIIDTPRISSGCNMDSYAMLTAMSELNFQLVQTHFMHPDDVLDEDRGAALGWEKMSENFEDYLKWLYTAAPFIRNMTGSEMGTAVEQYCNLSMVRTEEENGISVQLGGFSGEAYFLLRINKGKLGETENCQVEHLSGNLYLVHAVEDHIWIGLGE